KGMSAGRRVRAPRVSVTDAYSAWLISMIVVGVLVFAAQVAWAQNQQSGINDRVRLHVPDETTIPGGPLGTAIRYGKKVLTETQTYARAYVGNGLNCSSCHLDAGRKAYAAPLVGLWGMFPEY